MNALSTLMVSATVLPYAPTSLIFQSSDEVKIACTQFEVFADADINKFIQLSKEGDYKTAYQIWSDLLFRCYSFQLELGKTEGLSTNKLVQTSADNEGELLKKAFQQKLLSNSELLAVFLQNAEAASKLTPQQRLFTRDILKEYQLMDLNEKSKIDKGLQILSKEKTESFCQSKGLVAPIATETLSEVRVLTANIACFPGKLSYMFGGVAPWKDRIDGLLDIFRAANAQILCLQEVWDPEAMRAFADRLKNDYAFFVYDCGDPAGTVKVNKMGYSSGLFLASKMPLDTVVFSKFPRSLPEGSNRGMLIATCPVGQTHFALINTHLQHGDSRQLELSHEIRKEQLLLCYATLQEQISKTLPGKSWGCVAGDFNIDANSKEFQESGLSRLFSIPYAKQPSLEKPTWTDYFNDLVTTPLDQRSSVIPIYELIDYCVQPTLSPNPAIPEQKLIPLYNIQKPTEALSDHQALLTTWKVAAGSDKDD